MAQAYKCGINKVKNKDFPTSLQTLEIPIYTGGVEILDPRFGHLQSKKKLRMIAAIVLSLWYFSQTSLFVPGLNSNALFYFGLGAFLSLGEYSLTTVFKKYKILLICALVHSSP